MTFKGLNKKSVLILFCIFLLGINAYSSARMKTREQGKKKKSKFILYRQISDIMSRYKVVGLSYGVFRKDKIVALKSFGFSDRERGLATNNNTYYRIASISKIVTATAIMQLYEQGKCNLDADISHYLGYSISSSDFSDSPITIRHILTHTSGIADLEGKYLEFLLASYSNNPPSLEEIFSEGGRYYTKQLWESLPGEEFRYSNLSYGVLASIIEKISGERFIDYCRNHIFKPLTMKSSFEVRDIEDVDNIAVLYIYDKEQGQFKVFLDNYKGVKPNNQDYTKYKPGYNGLMYSPQGGVRTTLKDLCKLMIAYINLGKYKENRILKKKTVLLMFKKHWSGYDDQDYREQGLAFQLTNELIEGKTLIGHLGEAYGLLGLMFFDVKGKTGIIILMNGGDYLQDQNLFHQIEIDLYRLLYHYYID